MLLKLTKQCVFSVNNKLIKQIDGCPMGGPISVVFSGFYVSKMEDTVAPMKQRFCKRYVDDTYIRKKKNEPDSLFEKLNSYHLNIKISYWKEPYEILRYRNHSTWIWNRNKSLP